MRLLSTNHSLLLGITLLNLTPTALSQSASPPPTSYPSNIGMLLFPGFEVLDVFGPLSALNLLASLTKSQGTNITLAMISEHGGRGKSSLVSTNTTLPIYESVLSTHSFADIYRSQKDPASKTALDVLFIPGGPGARVVPDSYLNFIRTTYPCLKYLITVCTGSGVAAKSGVLDGRNATGNKAAWQWTISQGPRVKWVREARWVVDGNVWTTSGVAAGIDGTLAWIESVSGRDVAVRIGNLMEVVRNEDPSWDPFSDIWNATKRAV